MIIFDGSELPDLKKVKDFKVGDLLIPLDTDIAEAFLLAPTIMPILKFAVAG